MESRSSLWDRLVDALEPILEGEKKMTQKSIVRNTLSNRHTNSVYSLANAVERETGYRPADATIRRTVRDLRIGGANIVTNNGGYRLEL